MKTIFEKISQYRRVIAVLIFLIGAFVISVSLMPTSGNAVQQSKELECWWNIQEEIPQPYGIEGQMEIRVNVSMIANLARYFDSKKSRLTILNMDTNNFWIVKYDDKTLSEGTLEELNKLIADRRKADEDDLKKLEGQLKNFSGETLKSRQAYIAHRKAVAQFAQASLTAKTVPGAPVVLDNYKAQIVEVFYEGKKIGSVWVSTDIAPPDRWKNFVSIMSALEPLRWKVVEAAGRIPLKVESDLFGARIKWDFFRASNGPVSIGNFLLPNDYSNKRPTLEQLK